MRLRRRTVKPAHKRGGRFLNPAVKRVSNFRHESDEATLLNAEGAEALAEVRKRLPFSGPFAKTSALKMGLAITRFRF